MYAKHSRRTPHVSPFFLETLADALSGLDSEVTRPALPLLERLSLHLGCTVESFTPCVEACTKLAHVLTAELHYPAFAHLAVEFEEISHLGRSDVGTEEERRETARRLFGAFEDAGVKVEIAVRDSRMTLV